MCCRAVLPASKLKYPCRSIAHIRKCRAVWMEQQTSASKITSVRRTKTSCLLIQASRLLPNNNLLSPEQLNGIYWIIEIYNHNLVRSQVCASRQTKQHKQRSYDKNELHLQPTGNDGTFVITWQMNATPEADSKLSKGKSWHDHTSSYRQFVCFIHVWIQFIWRRVDVSDASHR